MKTGLNILTAAVLAFPSHAEGIAVPSGQPITFHEMIWDQPGAGLTYRFRFVAPSIARGTSEMDFDTVEQDMAYLCREYALPRVAVTGPQPGQIVISLSDQKTEFGQAVPEVTQVFEAYSVEGQDCIWEPF